MNHAEVLNHLQDELDALRVKLVEAEKKIDKVDALHTNAHHAKDVGQARWLERQINLMVRAYRNYFKARSQLLRRRLINACSFGSDRDDMELAIAEFNLRADMIGVDISFWKDDGDH